MKNKTHHILLTPGPVPLFQTTREHLGLKMTHHRSKEIMEALQSIQTQLKKVFQTQEHVYILNATGTGAMEASLVNTLSPGDKVLSICAGKFGERWSQMARSLQLQSYDISVPWGKAVDVASIQSMLQKHSDIRAVLIQACETSTAVTHPIQQIAKLIKNNKNTLLIVDAISALINTDLYMDEWGIDVLIGGSQKSLALPAGMSFLALSKKAQDFSKNSKLPRFYFDLEKEKKANAKGQTAFSGNVSFIRALKASLNEYQKIGLSRIQKNCQILADATHQFCEHLGLSLFSSAPSTAVTGICIPDGIDGVLVKKIMEEQNIIVGGGQDQLKGKIIRFGHIGAIKKQDYIQGLKTFGEVLREQKPEVFSSDKLDEALLKAQNIIDQSYCL